MAPCGSWPVPPEHPRRLDRGGVTLLLPPAPGTARSVPSALRMTKEGHFVSKKGLAEDPGLKTASPYQVGDEHLKKWIEFLRYYGGFEVW